MMLHFQKPCRTSGEERILKFQIAPKVLHFDFLKLADEGDLEGRECIQCISTNPQHDIS